LTADDRDKQIYFIYSLFFLLDYLDDCSKGCGVLRTEAKNFMNKPHWLISIISSSRPE